MELSKEKEYELGVPLAKNPVAKTKVEAQREGKMQWSFKWTGPLCQLEFYPISTASILPHYYPRHKNLLEHNEPLKRVACIIFHIAFLLNSHPYYLLMQFSVFPVQILRHGDYPYLSYYSNTYWEPLGQCISYNPVSIVPIACGFLC